MQMSIKADTPHDVVAALCDYCKHMYERALDQQVGATTVKSGQRWRGECDAYMDLIAVLQTLKIEPKDEAEE